MGERMKCYFTDEDCDCGGDMETECPHEEAQHEFPFDTDEDVLLGQREAETSERLDQWASS